MSGSTGIRVLLIVIVAVVVFVLVAYSSRNKARLESETFAALSEKGSKSGSKAWGGRGRGRGGGATKGGGGGGGGSEGDRRKTLTELEDDLDVDTTYVDEGKRNNQGITGNFLINEGEGRYAPAEFEEATRANTIEEHREMMKKSPVTGGVAPFEPVTEEVFRPVDPSHNTDEGSATVQDTYPGEKLKIDDLLPKDAANSTWAMANPAGQGDVRDQNFVTAGYHLGLNTVGQTNKNANQQIRSEPPNPRQNTGIWNQSTFAEPDVFRRPFELGSV